MSLRWEDERYVRFYTRNTPEWLSLSWQARALFGLIMREVDRAGQLTVGRLGIRGVAVAVQAPLVDIEGPFAELVADGCIVFQPERGVVGIPNFLAAQEAPQSDAARKRASREKARAQFGSVAPSPDVTNRDHVESQNVTESHIQSHAVTSGHVESRSVTPSVPSVPSVPIPPTPPSGSEVIPETASPVAAVAALGDDEPIQSKSLTAEQRYAAAWSVGVTKGANLSGFAVPEGNECGPLNRSIAPYAKGLNGKPLRGEALTDWFSAKGEQFARSVDRRFGGFTTKRFLEWLNAGCPANGDRPSGAYRSAGPRQALAPPNRPDVQARANAVLAMNLPSALENLEDDDA